VLEKLPSCLETVPVQDRQAVLHHGELRRAIDEANKRLGPDGRLFVRPSGTEPVIRVLGEGEDEGLVRSTVQEIVHLIASELS